MSSPATACAKDGTTVLGQNAGSACGGGTAYQCNWGVPWAVSNTLSYGYAAFNGNNCGKCYQLDFTGGKVQGKSMIVQVINVGDMGAGTFDLLIPGGGVGANNACTAGSNPQWGSGKNPGVRYGGFPSTCGSNMSCITSMCQAAFGNNSALMAGCDWYTGWFGGSSNPGVRYAQVSCPSAITSKSGMR